MAGQKTFYQTLSDAVNDIAAHGFDSAERLAFWQKALREAAESMLGSRGRMEEMLRDAYRALYRKLVDKEGILQLHPGVPRFSLNKVKPALHGELERRILASADLIKLNREQSIAKTLQRFSGWASSVPKGGSDQVNKKDEKEKIRKGMSALPFEERRVLVDQGHKFQAALSETLAREGGALAGLWRSNWRQANYDYREDHKERDNLVYAVRGNWAIEKGLMKKGPAGYTDDITQPAEEPFCRCRFVWIYNLRSLPPELLTVKGRDALEALRRAA